MVLTNLEETETDTEAEAEIEIGTKQKDLLFILLNQLTKLSSIYHQIPSEFVSNRSILIRNGNSLSPLEQSIRSLSIDNAELPSAWTKLLRNNRPAVANLLDLTYEKDDDPRKRIDEESLNNPISITSVKDKYANLLDLLD